MKRIFRRNQLIITGLVMLVAVAGYLSFSEKSALETLDWAANSKTTEKPEKELTTAELTEVDETSENTEETKVGEAVLTGAKVEDAFYSVKLEREQTRAENKAMLTEIVNNKNATKDQKDEAMKSMMEMSAFAEKENSAETVLNAKGFEGVVVSLAKDNADVVVKQETLNENELTQIMDVVSRKTGISMDHIVISVSGSEKEKKEK